MDTVGCGWDGWGGWIRVWLDGWGKLYGYKELGGVLGGGRGLGGLLGAWGWPDAYQVRQVQWLGWVELAGAPAPPFLPFLPPHLSYSCIICLSLPKQELDGSMWVVGGEQGGGASGV